ncbi:hybrid sensor histidine kinase/response regulator [Pedobacter sp. L105]|uniref:ATP-binding response regulator n=1 Tax=Pedobacter sp. L105 TaxID=1641871 RepID=UPI00131E892C|nr:hybrid sensor histidine kinase/response regulator [Pedobacter sp. L105]
MKQQSQILTRKILLSFLTLVILLSIAAFFVRDSITKKLEQTSQLAKTHDAHKSRAAAALLMLHDADNSFEGSLINNNIEDKNTYQVKLARAFEIIDTLVKEKIDTVNLSKVQVNSINLLSNKKIKLSDHLYVLKHSFDSLLTVYASFDAHAAANVNFKTPVVQVRKSETKTKSDTVKKESIKVGLMKRLREAITNKNNKADKVGDITKNNYNQQTDIITQQTAMKNGLDNNNKLKKLQQQNVKLLNTQRQLIILNSHIISELGGIVTTIKDINYKINDDFKDMILKSYQESTSLLNNLYLIALFLVLIFAGLLILFITQLNQSESHLHQEIERSTAIAQQKMELLHHMSHEIRNPLTAIRGFLYIFSKSNMSSKQVEMLESITLSSDMMLRTLTDTLDAAKMESSELRINPEPFNADFVLKKIIESMTFSAVKKKLSLAYHFTGNTDILILGDSFRLKQILINLLSNAIKYTDHGSITVNAQLSAIDNRLQIDIVDTGMGISADQQQNLFTKYYQTNSSIGKMGTGLGLFICKQLVEMQGGEISVKSNPGAGTTFSFFIPYEKTESAPLAEVNLDDPLSVINGKHILAVDDNELNLLFLQKIMQKWNVTFYQAVNGQDALHIIAKNIIDVVLTDLQMPVMDGETLLAHIKASEKPKNQIPVIVISGVSERHHSDKFIQMGFSGFVTKPFAEADLAEQIVKVLSK